MKKNILKLCVQDPQLRLRLALVFVAAGIALWQWTALETVELRLTQVKDQRGEMSRQIHLVRAQPLETLRPTMQAPMVFAKMEYTLEGMLQDGGINHALINGSVYSQGDRIDDYVIEEITMNSTILKSSGTNEIIRLFFDE